ncbi:MULTISPECIES: WapI family immunity protein [Spirosoma]|uniref:Uncharacterized protein n=1 Tax=Spirosoma liriopis TaxID=2937440 RepID=A0ABT0HKC0_9BACT|nr:MULTISPECIES: hypothetical protein [Spirosoma]MCK8492591.1 hypothetical protein [Spirosoma liriopis]UHG92060.1 hypothetical protein LQ777_03935 [Spirosoma oryzicola]
MKFISSAGSFEFSIVGYGAKTTNWRERNNLQCQVSTIWRQHHDSQATPLQTWEVQRLLSGLRSLSHKAANHITLTFSQSGLSLDATALPGDKYRLQIQLDHALTPAWHPYPDFPLEMDMVLNRKQLDEAIRDLSGQLATYPER